MQICKLYINRQTAIILIVGIVMSFQAFPTAIFFSVTWLYFFFLYKWTNCYLKFFTLVIIQRQSLNFMKIMNILEAFL